MGLFDKLKKVVSNPKVIATGLGVGPASILSPDPSVDTSGASASIQEQLQLLQAQQRQLQPFINQSLQARQQLQGLASAPLGQSALAEEKRRTGLRNISRALASQGSFFSGRLGQAAAGLEGQILGQDAQQQIQALQALSGLQPLGLSSNLALGAGRGFESQAQLSLLPQLLQAQQASQQQAQFNQLLGLGARAFGQGGF